MGIVSNVIDASLDRLAIAAGTYTASHSDPSIALVLIVYLFIRASVTCANGQKFYSMNWISAQPARHMS